MEKIVLIGHGSPKKSANNLDVIGRLLHSKLHPDCDNGCVKVSYLQFGEPDIMSAITECVMDGASRIIMHPYFLSSGMHVTKDIPATISEARGLYPDVEFVYTEPLGIHDKLINIVAERIRSANGLLPEEIENRSFQIIAEETDLSNFPHEQVPVIQRVIHATADFEFKNTLHFHPDAIKTGIEAIKLGKNILADIEMVKTGIIKRWLEPWGGSVVCNLNDKDVVMLSKETKKTRSEVAIEKGLNEDTGIVVIGNAPTALLKVIELFNSPIHRFSGSPVLVVGIPVGFVNALESKALLAKQLFPFITNLSRKGGTPVAVAIVNALLKMANEGG